MLTKFGMQVISGGQTGVDLAALRIAQCLGLRTGGLSPRGWKTTAGPKPQLKTTFGLEEGIGGYSDRTRKNVEQSHATLVLASNLDSPGTKLTIACVTASSKPLHTIMLPERGVEMTVIDNAVDFIEAEMMKVGEDPFVLNVAGNSSRTSPRIFVPAFFVLAEVIVKLSKKADLLEAEHVDQFKQRLLSDRQMINALVDNYEYYGELDPRGMRGMIV